MGYKMCDAADVEKVNGVFRPIRRALGLTAFGINEEEFPPNADGYPDHDHSEDGQEEVFYVLDGSGTIVVDGEDVELEPGRYVWVEAGSKRKILARRRRAQARSRWARRPGAYQPATRVAISASTSSTAPSRRGDSSGRLAIPKLPTGAGAGSQRRRRRLEAPSDGVRESAGCRAADGPPVRRQ